MFEYGYQFQNKIQEEIFDLLNFELVVYDEIEIFRQNTHPEFDYPYGLRKTSLDLTTFDVTSLYWKDEEKTEFEYESDYEYFSNNVKFQKSNVCLQAQYFNDVSSFIPTIGEFIDNVFLNQDVKQKTCDGKLFDNKIKYSKQRKFEKNLLDDYGRSVVENRIMYEFMLQLDPFKSNNQRSATQVYDYLGDVGGFQAAFQTIFATFGGFFSARFFQSSVASDLYL